MSDLTPDRQKHLVDLLRSALAATRLHGGREVRFGTDGISVTDPLGVARSLTVGAAPPEFDVDELKALLDTSDFQAWSNSSNSDMEREVEGQGIWKIGQSGNDAVVLKPKKAFPAALEMIFEAPPEELESLRSLYMADGIDVVLLVDGETRCNDVSVAIAAERGMAGLGSKDLVDRFKPYSSYRRWEGHSNGTLEFDASSGSVRPWTSHQALDRRSHITELPDASTEDPTRVVGDPTNTGARHSQYPMRLAEHMERKGRPVVVVRVAMVDSRPKGNVHLGELARQLALTVPRTATKPWETVMKRRKDRQGTKTPVPKTWHPTTKAVAEAYVAREAPRGKVGGDSLYFHGPVAFSIWDTNPIAAFVDMPDGRVVMFSGREDGIGGTKGGVVSMAQNDVRQALHGRPDIEIVEVDDFRGFVRLGDIDFGQKAGYSNAWKLIRGKNEADFPRSCHVDEAGLSDWLIEHEKKAQIELADSMRTSFPTGRKACAYAQLARITEMRDRFVEMFGLALPELEPASKWTALYEEMRAAMSARGEALAEKRRNRVVPDEDADEPDDEDEDEPAAGFGM